MSLLPAVAMATSRCNVSSRRGGNTGAPPAAPSPPPRQHQARSAAVSALCIRRYTGSQARSLPIRAAQPTSPRTPVGGQRRLMTADRRWHISIQPPAGGPWGPRTVERHGDRDRRRRRRRRRRYSTTTMMTTAAMMTVSRWRLIVSRRAVRGRAAEGRAPPKRQVQVRRRRRRRLCLRS